MKQVHEFHSVYGYYIDDKFVQDLLDISTKAHKMSDMYLRDCLNKSTHHEDVATSSKAVQFWRALESRCKSYLKKDINLKDS